MSAHVHLARLSYGSIDIETNDMPLPGGGMWRMPTSVASDLTTFKKLALPSGMSRSAIPPCTPFRWPAKSESGKGSF